MSIVTMNMSSYEIQRNEEHAAEYGEEVLSASWFPRLAQQEVLAEQWENRHCMPAELAEVDVHAFLRKMYRNQR